MTAIALVAAGLNVAHAEPPATRGEGFACRLAATGAQDSSVHSGVIAGGPIALADLPGVSSRNGVEWGLGTPSQGEITCGIQVNHDLHPVHAWVAQVSASGSPVVTLAPTPVSYVASPGAVVALCTIWHVWSPSTGWRTLYYNAPSGGFTDNPYRAQCATVDDPSEPTTGQDSGTDEGGSTDPAVRVDAYGHIVITGDSSGISFTTSDRYADSFSCSITSYSPVTVTCTPNFPNSQNADAFYCQYFIITATTSSPSAAVHGVASCLGHTGAPLSGGDAETNDVSGSNGSDQQTAAGYYDENVDVTSVVCVARGINGSTTPTADFSVDCYEPGLPAVVR
jgi:hypothetical protein